jgi:amicoumacin kinase
MVSAMEAGDDIELLPSGRLGLQLDIVLAGQKPGELVGIASRRADSKRGGQRAALSCCLERSSSSTISGQAITSRLSWLKEHLMDPTIAARFNDALLAAAMQHYDIAADKIQLLDGFESFIYEFSRPDGDYILRIGHSLRRTPAMIHGEVDWINYLSDHGVTVARALLSRTGNLVEHVEDGQGGAFLCTAFAKARGGSAGRDKINERLFLNYGRLLGHMHALAKDYIPSNPAWKRYAWDGPENNTPDRQLPATEAVSRQEYQAVFDRLRSLPRDRDGYGMIHQDAHLGNLFVDDDYVMTLFDFDDSVYGHFVYDIAMVLFYIAGWGGDDTSGFTGRFMPVFFQGYREFNRLDPLWLKEIPHFLKLREIDLFAAILYTMGEDPQDDPWCARYMKGRREKIANKVPFIQFDWETLAAYM